jgi:hypothetical protein
MVTYQRFIKKRIGQVAELCLVVFDSKVADPNGNLIEISELAAVSRL